MSKVSVPKLDLTGGLPSSSIGKAHSVAVMVVAEKKVKLVSEMDLKAFLLHAHKEGNLAGRIVTIESLTIPDMVMSRPLQTPEQCQLFNMPLTKLGAVVGNPFIIGAGKTKAVQCRKHFRGQGKIVFDYENVVNAQLERENKTADFKAQSRTWGWHLANTPITEWEKDFRVEHYLNAMTDGKVLVDEYLHLDGKPFTDAETEEIEMFLSDRKPSKTQGTDKDKSPSCFKLQNILAMTFNGMSYVVDHDVKVFQGKMTPEIMKLINSGDLAVM